MKKFILFLVLGWAFAAQAQLVKPYKLAFSVAKPEVAVGETTELLVEVTINSGWHLYSSDQDPDVGPLPTELNIKPGNKTIALVGKLVPDSQPIEKDDEIFGGKVRYFEKKATFRQKIKILSPTPVIEGALGGQVCKDDGVCIPINDGDFKITNLKVSAAKTEEKKKPEEVTSAPEVEAIAVTPVPTREVASSIEKITPKKTESISIADLLLAFLAGLTAVAMPCVYPMLPMTVAMFTKRVASRREGLIKATFYGISIVLILTFFGTLVSAVFGSGFTNFLSTHWFPNLLIFGIFVLFSLSFLGAFELNLPNNFVNSVDAQADKGGWGGIFFMAFSQALVSFSCTAPIVGTAAILASTGSIWQSAALNLSFGTAFALPFVVAAFVPNLLNSLPRSGGWLNTLKVQLGFLELAIALKFLSIPDQTYHWGILDRDVFLALWIVIFTLMGLNIIGKIRLPHDSPMETVSVPRTLWAILLLGFAVYLIPGLFGAPLRPLSGLLPPENAQDFNLHSHNPNIKQSEGTLPPNRKYAEFLKTPQGLEGFYDYSEALAYAKQVGKPLFVDFTGHGCVNCRKMEETVWSKPEVLARLSEDFVIVSLYVDDKTELPENQHYTSKLDGKVKSTIGDQNLDFEIERFNFNAQPLYVVLDPENDKQPLLKPISYQPEGFLGFLTEAKKRFGE